MIQTLSEAELAQLWLIYFSVSWPHRKLHQFKSQSPKLLLASLRLSRCWRADGSKHIPQLESLFFKSGTAGGGESVSVHEREQHEAPGSSRVFQKALIWGLARPLWFAWPSKLTTMRNKRNELLWWETELNLLQKKGREWRKETSTYNKVINFDVQLWTICEDISDHVACWVEVCYYFSTQFAAVKNMEKTL